MPQETGARVLHYVGVVLALAVLISGGLAPAQVAPASGVRRHGTASQVRLLAYYPFWNPDYRADAIPYTQLTHICHAFLQPQADGSLLAPAGYVEPELILDAHAHGVRVLTSIGGADPVAAASFALVASSAPLRDAFANAVVAFCSSKGYDGVDIDWEFPESAADRANLTLLVQTLRASFDAAPPPAPSWDITMAIPAGDYYGRWFDYGVLDSLVSFYNLMTYDFHGSWSDHSGHNSPLYQGSDPYAWENTNWGVEYMLVTRGVASSRINLGIPFYGREFLHSEALYDSCAGDCSTEELDYRDIAPLLLPGSGWTSYWDTIARVPFLHNDGGPGVLTYDSPDSAAEKVDYALSNRQLGGVFMWEISADADGSGQPLMTAMYEAVARNTADVIFWDGFESGDATAWSSLQP